MVKRILLSMLLGASATTLASEQTPPKEMVCRSCHGVGGATPIMDTYPKLSGQNKAYLVSILKSYRAGKRVGGMSAIMTAQSKSLSDADIEALAIYYANQK